MKKVVALLLALALVATLIAGCSDSGNDSSSGSDSSTTSSTTSSGSESSGSTDGEFSGTITFGIGCPLSGTNASYGELMQLGAQIGADWVNEEGGINGQQVVISALDDQNDMTEVALVAQRFADDSNIYAVICHGGSSQSAAAAPIYEAAGMTNMAPSSSNYELTEQGYQYFVRHVIKDTWNSPQVIAQLVNNLGCENIGIVYANNDYGVGNREAAESASAALGVEINLKETYTPTTDKDFTAILTKIQAAGLDGLGLYADYTEGGMFMNQAAQLGLTDSLQVVCQNAVTYMRFIELAGGAENLKNVYIQGAFNPYEHREPVEKFLSMFREHREESEIPSEPCGFSCDIVRVFAQAIEAGADRSNLALWIKNLVDGQEPFVAYDLNIGEENTWDKNGDINPRGVYILKVNEDGEFYSTDEKVDITGLNMEGVMA